MKKTGLFVLLALSVMAVTGCGNKDSDSTVVLQEVTEKTTEDELLDQPTEGTTQEPTTRIVEQTEEATVEDIVSEDGTDSQGTGITAISPEDATAMLMVTLGERDEETGNEYSYGYIENVQIDGVTYLVFDWRWLVDDHTSKITDLFVTADGSKIYEGLYNGPENSEVYLDNPLN